MHDTAVLVPGRMDGDIAFEITGERHRILYSDRYRVSGISGEGGYWFDESYERDEFRVEGPTGWYDLDEDGVRSDVILRVDAHPLRVRIAPGVERWTLAPRVLPPGWWTVWDGSGPALTVRATGSGVVEVQARRTVVEVAADFIDAAMLSPIVLGLPAHVIPISAGIDDAWATEPVERVERVRLTSWSIG